MQKILALLSLVSLAFAQLPIFGSANTTASFGVSTSVFLASVTTVAGGVKSTSVGNINVGQLLSLGLNVQIVVSSQSVGTVSLFGNSYVGGNINSLAGVSSSGGVGGAASVGIQTNFGFTVKTDLAPGTFQVSLIVTPAAGLGGLLTRLSSTLQLFYSVNATTGPYSASSSGSADGSFFGAIPSTVTYNGNAVASYNFTLPSVSTAVLVAANVDFSAGVTATTPAVFPVLFGTVAKVKAGVSTAYYFSKNFLIQLNNSVDTTIQATLNTAYNANIKIAANASAGINTDNTAYAGFAVDVNVATQTNLGATLVQSTSSMAVKEGQKVAWALYDQATGTATLLTDSVYDAASATVSVKVNHFSTYAAYYYSATGGNNNSAASAFVSAVVVLAALLLAL